MVSQHVDHTDSGHIMLAAIVIPHVSTIGAYCDIDVAG